MKKPATKDEKEFMARVASLNCITCGNFPVQIHHICESSKRIGHKFVLPLCPECHESKFSIGNAKKSFIAMYGTELELCQKMYKMLGMEYKPKESKVYGRN